MGVTHQVGEVLKYYIISQESCDRYECVQSYTISENWELKLGCKIRCVSKLVSKSDKIFSYFDNWEGLIIVQNHHPYHSGEPIPSLPPDGNYRCHVSPMTGVANSPIGYLSCSTEHSFYHACVVIKLFFFL